MDGSYCLAEVGNRVVVNRGDLPGRGDNKSPCCVFVNVILDLWFRYF